MERLKCLNLEPVTFVGTYAASLPLGNAESSRPAVLSLHDNTDLVQTSFYPQYVTMCTHTFMWY
jgi:hypothetical protein